MLTSFDVLLKDWSSLFFVHRTKYSHQHGWNWYPALQKALSELCSTWTCVAYWKPHVCTIQKTFLPQLKLSKKCFEELLVSSSVVHLTFFPVNVSLIDIFFCIFLFVVSCLSCALHKNITWVLQSEIWGVYFLKKNKFKWHSHFYHENIFFLEMARSNHAIRHLLLHVT